MPDRILMIDDDVDLAHLVGEYLGARGLGFETRADASSGLEQLAKSDYDALILDVMLPDMDGFEVCRRVRAASDVPVLMLTARGDELDRIVGLELGADDYLPKPFNPRELLARLRAILRRGRHAADRTDRTGPAGGTDRDEESWRFGELEIDRAARRVRVAGEERELTSHQFDLLCVLAQNAGRVLSRDQIMRKLRGEALSAFDRSIDVHVSRIRAAIETDPRRPRRLLTVRGSGYVFTRESAPPES